MLKYDTQIFISLYCTMALHVDFDSCFTLQMYAMFARLCQEKSLATCVSAAEVTSP